MTDKPAWLDDFLDAVGATIESLGAPGPMGFEYSLENDLWQVRVYPQPVEFFENDAIEYGTAGFSADIEALRSVFEKIDAITFTVNPFQSEAAEDLVVSIEGTFKAHAVWLQVLASPPEDVEPSYRVFVGNDGTSRLEKIPDPGAGDDLSFGAVLVTAGEYQGKIGYYDDDEGSLAIVYFGKPLHPETEHHLIQREHLRNVTALEHERFKRENPNFCETLGID